MSARARVIALVVVAGCVTEEVDAVDQAVTGTDSAVSPLRASSADLALDPLDGDHLIGGASDLTSGQMVAYESSDGGGTWTTTELPLGSPGATRGERPAIAFSSAGTALYCEVEVDASNNRTLACRRHARGGAWEAPAIVADAHGVALAIDDQPIALTVDRTGGVHDGTFDLAFTSASYVAIATTTDGTAFALHFVTTLHYSFPYPATGTQPRVAIGPDGSVFVTYVDPTYGVMCDMLDPATMVVSRYGLVTLPNGTASSAISKIASDPQHGVPDPGLAIDVDRSNGLHRGAIYIASAVTVPGNGLDLYVVTSADGLSWQPVRVEDDPLGIAHDQFMPRLAVDDTTGAITVAWYDTRLDPTNHKADLYVARSRDGGAAFSTNLRVSSASSDESGVAASPAGYGDSIGLVASGVVRTLWTDSRSGSEQTYATTFAPPPTFGLVPTLPPPAYDGGTVTFDVRADGFDGFTGAIAIAAAAPVGGTASVSPASIGPGGVATVTVNLGTIPAGATTVTVTGTSGGLARSIAVPLAVSWPLLTVTSATSVVLQQGRSVAATVTTKVIGGCAVGLTATELPAGVTATLSPSTIAAPGNGASTLTLTAGATAALAATTIHVKGNCGGVIGTAAIVLGVVPATMPSQLVVNGGFEGSAMPWALAGVATRVAGSSYAHSGSGLLDLVDIDSASGSASQSFSIPSAAASATLDYWVSIYTNETTKSYAYDHLFVELVDASGAVTVLRSYSNLNATSGYAHVSIDLSAYRGHSVRLVFQASTDSAMPTRFLIDDVSVYAPVSITTM